jgi:hypothetical protein
MKRPVLLLGLTVALAGAACDGPPNDKPETTETARGSLVAGQSTTKPVDDSPANPEVAALSTIEGKDPGPPRKLSSKEAVDFHAHLKALAEARPAHPTH